MSCRMNEIEWEQMAIAASSKRKTNEQMSTSAEQTNDTGGDRCYLITLSQHN